MSFSARSAALLAALLLTAACGERPSPLEPRAGNRPAPGGSPVATESSSPDQPKHERLARRLALALGDPAFRSSAFQALKQSRVREGKVHLQRFLEGNQRRLLHRVAELAGEDEATIAIDLDQSAPIEIYLPVPAHRRAWAGGPNLLVATAEGDRDAPVGFDIRGKRQLLDPVQPPNVPVIALVRAEVSFDAESGPAGAEADDTDPNKEAPTSGGAGPGPNPGTNPSLSAGPGLYLTYARINSTFEGWLKGAPEFEVHILGQDGNSSAMRTYQCAGESAGVPYQYNQDETEWRGSVLLFSQAQLDGYKAEHPGQAVRILVMEDDDTRCVIKTDSARIARFFSQIAASYGQLTGGRDTLISVKTFRKAQTIYQLLKAFWSTLQTQDEIVGTAIEDTVVGEYYSGANWIIKGENTVTHGAMKLEMR